MTKYDIDKCRPVISGFYRVTDQFGKDYVGYFHSKDQRWDVGPKLPSHSLLLVVGCSSITHWEQFEELEGAEVYFSKWLGSIDNN